MKRYVYLLMGFLVACQQSDDPEKTVDLLRNQEALSGKAEYLTSPFVAAGDRLYMVGHQDGSFPDLGWHVKGEMGGIWDHPIKLMDGFSLHVSGEDLDDCLDDAISFTNYPVGNMHRFEKEGLTINRYQFVPDGQEVVVVFYEFVNETDQPHEMEVTFTGLVDLSPVWLADSLGLEDGNDEVRWDPENQVVIARDANNPWYTVFGSTEAAESIRSSPCTQERNGFGTDASIKSDLVLAAKGTTYLGYFIAGSYRSEEEAIATFQTAKSNHYRLLQEKLDRYEEMTDRSALNSGDEGFDQMFRWVKYNSDWLVRDVKEEGRGLSAGIPDYPWWFGTDNGYTIQGLLAAGMHEEAINTIDLIIDISRRHNGNGQIVHEVSTNGVVFNPGNLNTTPYFIYTLWRAYEWTGDQRIPDNYYQDVLKGMDWIASQDKDGNGYPDGAGMMEIHGLHSEMIDVVSYLAKAYQAAANFALVKGEIDRVEAFEQKANSLKQKINEEWWVDSFGSFADFRSSKKEALDLIDAALVRADTINKPWSVDELKETRKNVYRQKQKGVTGYVVHHNWVVNTPMEMGLADSSKATVALKTANAYKNRFGMFVTGIDRDEEQEKAAQWKSFSYVGAVMTLPTGVQAIASARYGYPDQSLDYLKRLENSFGYALPGSMYEVSPDFGMIVQAWNIYAVAVPVVSHLFGVYPAAFRQKVFITPNLPSAWDDASLRNIRIGDNQLSIDFKREGNTLRYRIEQSLPDWQLVFENIFPGKMSVNDQPVLPEDGAVILSGASNNVMIIMQ